MKIRSYKFTLQTQGKISGFISLNCVDKRSCYKDRCIQKILRFALHLKCSFQYKNSGSDSNLNVVSEVKMHGSADGSCQTLCLQGLPLSLANAIIFQTFYMQKWFFVFFMLHTDRERHELLFS